MCLGLIEYIKVCSTQSGYLLACLFRVDRRTRPCTAALVLFLGEHSTPLHEVASSLLGAGEAVVVIIAI